MGPSSAFQPTTMWLLGLVRNGGQTALERWLRVQTWRLRDVRLFGVDADSGTLLAEHEAGLRARLSQRAIRTVEATFPVRLAPGQRVFLLLRVQDKTFGPLSVQLFEPEALQQSNRNNLNDQSTLFGSMLVLVLALLAQVKWPFALVAVWVGIMSLLEFAYQVPLLLTLFPGLRPSIVPLLIMTGSLGAAMFAVASLMFLDLGRSRVWRLLLGDLGWAHAVERAPRGPLHPVTPDLLDQARLLGHGRHALTILHPLDRLLLELGGGLLLRNRLHRRLQCDSHSTSTLGRRKTEGTSVASEQRIDLSADVAHRRPRTRQDGASTPDQSSASTAGQAAVEAAFRQQEVVPVFAPAAWFAETAL